MKRQKLRKALVLISFLLFPITLYYLSPYLIIQGAYEGIVTGSFIVFTLIFLVSLFMGRAFCGWVCPAGGLQECCTMAVDKKAKGGKLNWIKYIIWIPWVSIIILMFKTAGGFKQIDFFYQTDHGVSVTSPQAYIIFYAVILLIVVLSLTAGRRSFCHYACWMSPFMIIGSKLKNALKYPSLHLKANKDKCISCSACTKKCPMSLEVMDMVHSGTMTNSECILCGECVDVCPKSVIKYSIND
jgi:ferredoxin-type protein NapH